MQVSVNDAPHAFHDDEVHLVGYHGVCKRSGDSPKTLVHETKVSESQKLILQRKNWPKQNNMTEE